jgi:type I restriction enzyme S subunit
MMNKNKEHKKLVPELRFVEFSESWNYTILGKIIDLLSGYAFKSKYFTNEGKKLLTPKNFTKEGYGNFTLGNTKYTTENSDPKYVCREGDLLLLLTDLTSTCELLGKPLFVRKKDGNVLLNQRIAKVRPSSEVDMKFLLYFFLSESFHKRIKNTATGSTVRHSSNKIILKSKIFLPALPEQQKIAATLTTLDDLIAAEKEKLDALAAHKKGLLQQLFPAEGEKVPVLRFGGFGGDWVEKELIEVTDENIKWSFTGGPFGSNLKSSDYVQENKGVRIIQLQNIGDGEFKNDYKIFTSKEKADELISNNIYPGDIIMSKMGDPVGRACLIPNFHNRYVMSSDGIRVVVDENRFDKYFVYVLINSKLFRTKIENSSTGSTRKRISLSVLKKLSFLVPRDIKEQQKIGNTLLSLDELISSQSEKIEDLKNHKKGLMQQMFPNINVRR